MQEPDCTSLRIAFAGTPEFAARALASLLASRHQVVVVLSQPDRPAGRGRTLTPCPVKALALAHGVSVQQPPTLRDADAVASLAACRPDVLVVAAYGLLLPEEVLALPPLGCLNIHASLLPRWRGAAPIQRAILAGDTVTGVDIMQMDAGLDTGAVLLEHSVPIHADDTATTLHDRLAAVGSVIILEALEGRCRGALIPRPQPADGVTYAAKLDKREARLDFEQPALELDRQVRAFNPWPVAETTLEGERVRVWKSHPSATQDQGLAPAGTILGVSEHGIEVATGSGLLVLEELQRDGGKAAGAKAYVQHMSSGVHAGRQLVGRRFGT